MGEQLFSPSTFILYFLRFAEIYKIWDFNKNTSSDFLSESWE